MRTPILAALLAVALLLSGCTVTYRPGVSVQSTGAKDVHIPPGHLPPPGMCRIWYEGRPPGQQPPPGGCRKLEHEVPPGAILVRG